MRLTIKFHLLGVIAALSAVSAFAAEAWYPMEVDVWDPPFNSERIRNTEIYMPLAEASQPWRICVSIPHLKDDYWTAVNFGLIDEARRLGIRMQLFEAGGYGNLETQRTQISECMDDGADALIVSAISEDGLNDLLEAYIRKGKRVIDLINGLSARGITARAAVDYWDLGFIVSQYLNAAHRDDAGPVRLAWFPGPSGAGWVAAGDAGLRAGLDPDKFEIVVTSEGDTGLAVQAGLVEDALDVHPDVDYIVGTTVTAEAAVRVLRKRGIEDRVKVLAYYYSPGVDRGLRRNQIVAAPTDMPTVQARIAVDQAVRALEKQLTMKHVAPKVQMLDRNELASFDTTRALPPRGFRPIFSVNEW